MCILYINYYILNKSYKTFKDLREISSSLQRKFVFFVNIFKVVDNHYLRPIAPVLKLFYLYFYL